jgi:hypothetical protein
MMVQIRGCVHIDARLAFCFPSLFPFIVTERAISKCISLFEEIWRYCRVVSLFSYENYTKNGFHHSMEIEDLVDGL